MTLRRGLCAIVLVLFLPFAELTHAQSRCGCDWSEPGCQRRDVLGCDTERSEPGQRSGGESSASSFDFFRDNPISKYIREAPQRRHAHFLKRVQDAEEAAAAGNRDAAIALVRAALSLEDDEELRKWLARAEQEQRFWAKVGAVDDAMNSRHVDRALQLAREALQIKENSGLRKWIADTENQKLIDKNFERMRLALDAGKMRQAVAFAENLLGLRADPELQQWVDRYRAQFAMEEDLALDRAQLLEHERRFPAPPSPCQNNCVKLGLVVGIAQEYQTFHYTPLPGQRAAAEIEYYERLERAGVRPDYFVRLKDYDYVIGLAVSSNKLNDIGMRGVWDNFASGRATPVLQKKYDELRGKIFGTLDCYSNGAMICLAALANRHASAKTVRLIGPQITELAMLEWNGLLRRGEIDRLQIFINRGDPVPPISTVANYLVPGVRTHTYSLMAVNAILDRSGLRDDIARNAPRAEVIVLNCRSAGYTFTMACHTLESYDLSNTQ
jgi:hypothetical protein